MIRFLPGALVLVLSLLVSAGCATKAPVKPADLPPNDFEQSLMESASLIAKSRRVLSEVSNAKILLEITDDEHAQLFRQAHAVPPGLDRQITLAWDGPAHRAVEVVGRLTNYRVRRLGEPIGPGPMVRLRATNRQAVDILREIGTSVSGSALVRVIPQTDATEGVIELVYQGLGG